MFLKLVAPGAGGPHRPATRSKKAASGLLRLLTYLVATIILSVSAGAGVFSELAAGSTTASAGNGNAVGMAGRQLHAIDLRVGGGWARSCSPRETSSRGEVGAGLPFVWGCGWTGHRHWRSRRTTSTARADAPQGQRDSREVFRRASSVTSRTPRASSSTWPWLPPVHRRIPAAIRAVRHPWAHHARRGTPSGNFLFFLSFFFVLFFFLFPLFFFSVGLGC